MKIIIDGSKAETRQNFTYKGQGMISCNGSSRLLLDYKEKCPDTYYKLLEYLFGKNGLGFTHFKVEMGSDVNTSSGTEPTVRRYEDEETDVRRGAGFRLAADIKRLYPHVTLDMLWWSEPRYVTDAPDVYAARYRWYKETLDAAYETYGLVFDNVSANRNERDIDSGWIIYLSDALKSERDCPYDYSKIKIVAADECGSWNISWQMTDNERLREAVDIIGSHYTSFADDRTKALAENHGREIWFSEGSAPMTYAPSVCRFDEGNSGLTGINGVLDIANRMITMVSCGYMTMYEYQPAVAAYYDGVNYCQKQLINAAFPWSGYYTLDSGFYMNLHFSRFMEKGWSYIYSACHSDGKMGGDGHALVDAKSCYITTCGSDGNYSTVITNTTSEPVTYDIEVSGLAKSDSMAYVWETRGPERGQPYNANYFKKIKTITPEKGKYSVTVKPYSLVTVSTLDIPEASYDAPSEEENTVLALPYYDNFDYSDEFLSERGGAPLYTTDQGGAFEVIKKDGKNVLMQKITPDIKADEWGGTPEPTTNFGDDRWYNYSVGADVLTCGSDSYAGVGMRYILAAEGRSGYGLIISAKGEWQLITGNDTAERGIIEGFDPSIWHNVKISAVYDEVSAYIDGERVAYLKAEGAGYSAGRAALYSSYNNCCFDNIAVEAADDAQPYVKRLDNFDDAFTYSPEGWEHITMDSFKSYRRTSSKGSAGAALRVSFEGTGIILTGAQSGGIISVKLDGNVIEEEYVLRELSHRRTFLSVHGLESGSHTLELKVLGGECSVDSAQVSI